MEKGEDGTARARNGRCRVLPIVLVPVLRPLRLLPALLAFSFVLMAAAPALAYVCTMDEGCCCPVEETRCPPAEMPIPMAEACCDAHPATLLSERAVVPTPLDVPALPVLWTLAPLPPAPPTQATADLDTGPPPVRSHLAFAVLLI